jgi:hypothetical protein
MGAVATLRKGFLNMRRPLVIYDFATAPFWISLYVRKILLSFLSVTGSKIYSFYSHGFAV